MTQKTPITVIERNTQKAFEEIIFGEKWIRWAYQDASSTWIEKFLFKSSFISKLLGWWYDSSFSKSKIKQAIDQLNIDETEFEHPTDSYKNFNEFFIRHLKEEARPYSKDERDIVSPADGRVLVFPKLENATFAPVKGYPFDLHKMIPDYAEKYKEGALAIVRLCPADYHRYHFPCDGKIVESRLYEGALHSVNPIALGSGADVFGENKRCITLIETEQAGQICFIEVGAFGVGSIVNTTEHGVVTKMQEKGYFKFGGSTVVLLFEKDKVTFSDDLVTNSQNGFETLIKVGEDFCKIVQKS